MPLDSRLPLFVGQGVTPVRDPLQTMGAVYQLQGQQQQQQVNQLQLDAAQRAEFERQNLGQAIRGTMTTDPTTGAQTPNLPGALAQAYTTSRDPLALFKVQQDYTKGEVENRKTLLEARKVQLEQSSKQLEFGGQVAAGVKAAVARGEDPQAAWNWGLNTLRGAGFPIQGVTATFDANLLEKWSAAALDQKTRVEMEHKAVTQQLVERTESRLEREAGRKEREEAQRLGLEERKTAVQEQAEARQAGKPVIEPGQEMQNELLALYGPKARLTDYTTEQYAQAQKNVIDAAVQKARETGTSQIVQTPDGYFRVNPRSGAVERVEGPTGATLQPKPTTEEQRAASFATGGQQAHDQALALEQKGVGPTPATRTAQALPFNLGNYLLPAEQQQYQQAILQFTQNLLRKESGAAISQSEYDMTNRTYFPQPGDGPEVIKQKQQARATKLEEMRREGQRATTGAPAPAGKTLTEADIATTMQRSGKTRQEVLDAARQKGYTVPEK